MGPQFIPNSPLFHIVRKYILYLFQRRFAPFGYNYISSKMFQRVKSGMNPSPYTFLAFLRKVPTASTRLWSSPPPGSGKNLDKILIAYSATRTDLRSPFGFSQNLSPSLARIPTGSMELSQEIGRFASLECTLLLGYLHEPYPVRRSSLSVRLPKGGPSQLTTRPRSPKMYFSDGGIKIGTHPHILYQRFASLTLRV